MVSFLLQDEVVAEAAVTVEHQVEFAVAEGNSSRFAAQLKYTKLERPKEWRI